MTDTIPEVSDVGTVHRLDDRRPPADAVPVDLVKEVTTAPLPERVRFARSRQAVRIARLAATDPRTRKVAALGVRHTSFVVGGSRVVVRRTWDGRTVSAHQKMIAAAIAAGDLAAVADWQDKMDQYRQQRHARRMQLLSAPQVAAKSLALGTAGTVGGLLLLGIALAVANGDVHDVLAPTLFVIDVIKWACFIAAAVWGFAKVAGLPLALFGLWAVGRARGTAPDWALPAGRRSDDGAPVTPSIVVQALRDLGVAPLKNAIKEMGDAGAGMLSAIVKAGCGVEVDVLLPSGVSSDQVQDRRRRLAENLNRHEHELHISIPPAARSVRLWIADSGALDKPIGPSPLVIDDTITANYKTGRAPWGQDLRGDAVMVSLFQRHMLITGLSNQGKTASLRALALWLALDPRVDFRLADLKGVGDWQMFDGLATVLIQGSTDDHVIDATHMVEDVVTEMERRGPLMRELAASGWSMDKILADDRFRPIVVIVDEAQVAYGSAAVETYVTDSGTIKKGAPYGGSKADSRYFRAIKAIHDQGRAVSVTTWEGTQDPTNENLPKRSREGNHIRASLVVGTESQAEMAVGAQALAGGAAPHKLRQGLDKGTLVMAGDGAKLAPGQTSVTVRTHFIDGDDAKEIAQRAKDRRAGITTAAAVVPAGEPVDHLADILAVLGSDERVRTQEVLQRLAALNPAEYKSWTFITLKSFLEPFGAGPYKSGHMVISRERVAEALANRNNGGADDDAE
jgi:S-DNA-T family DNA segregation ATPase FtsK/SpoIIIE